MSFAPDTLRPATFFRGRLNQKLPFREALSALHDVVVSDQRFQPKDRTEYFAWRAQQDELDWTELGAQRAGTRQRIEAIRAELDKIQVNHTRRTGDFYKARKKYFDYLYKANYAAWWVLDPVITVHPDELFFECFSRDESSYGRVGCNYNVFDELGERACGTTNIDYSDALYDEFSRIRDYKVTELSVDPTGFEVETQGADRYREVKIDLPDSWVRGFLQVSSAMTLPGVQLQLHPMDIYNFCHVLRRQKERHGPRSMRWLLKPGQPVRVRFEPFDLTLTCARSVYTGSTEQEIRTWGRRRLFALERLIPVARGFTVTLLGTGMPSFWEADLGDLRFTLGLSGWTSNDWSACGNFDLLAPRARVDTHTAQKVFDALRADWVAEPGALARKLGLERKVVLGALAMWAQAGRVMVDLGRGVYRARELTREPLPMDRLRFTSDREAEAWGLVNQGAVTHLHANQQGEHLRLQGQVRQGSHTERPTLRLDRDQRVADATCTCSYFFRNKLRRGPCAHILALRLAHGRRFGVAS
ncbi:MAG: SWIM zinc finger family protein [Alphaproteobacteria bacterium]|nr:SWIM zinc finger family protein [Alphaproteobacteria bacterium]